MGSRIMNSRCEVSLVPPLHRPAGSAATEPLTRPHTLTLVCSTTVHQVIEKLSGRIIASGTLSKMQPREEDSIQKVRL